MYPIFSRVINRAGKMADFLVINRVRYLGSGLHIPPKLLWEHSLPLPPRDPLHLHVALCVVMTSEDCRLWVCIMKGVMKTLEIVCGDWKAICGNPCLPCGWVCLRYRSFMLKFASSPRHGHMSIISFPQKKVKVSFYSVSFH